MTLALSDAWAQLLAVLIPAIVSLLVLGGKMLMEWVKTQKWVQKAHLESVFAGLIPLAIEWVESWAGMQAEKPTSEAKMDKFKTLIKASLPAGTKVSDEELTLRAEAALKKMKNGE